MTRNSAEPGTSRPRRRCKNCNSFCPASSGVTTKGARAGAEAGVVAEAAAWPGVGSEAEIGEVIGPPWGEG